MKSIHFFQEKLTNRPKTEIEIRKNSDTIITGTKMKKATPWNIQDHLKTNENRVKYLEAALEENDKEFIAIALGDIAESLGLLAIIYDRPSKLYANGLRVSVLDRDIKAIVEKYQKDK